MNKKKKCLVIGELSANHLGSLDNAIETIKAFSKTGIDGIKIQTYTADTMTINCRKPPFIIENGTIWDGETYYDLYDKAHTPWEWYDDLNEYTKSKGMLFFSTPFDFSSVDFLVKKDPPYFKIASFELVDIPLIEYTASKMKPMIMSTGIATELEIEESIKACKNQGNDAIILLHCISSYPAEPIQFNLRTMVDMKERYGVEIGLSDHSLYPEPSLAAVALGASVIEKHIILDRNLGGPDSSFSVEPGEMKSLVTSIRVIEDSLGKVDYSLNEKKNKNRMFSRSLFASRKISCGESFNSTNIKSIRPSGGIEPKYYYEIIKRTASRDIEEGTPLSWDMIS